MLYQSSAPGDWGSMQATADGHCATESLLTPDGCTHFLRSWVTGGSCVLLILHGLGGHSGWYIDMGNALAQHGITVYALDHRGFGRSGGQPGHIDRYHTYIEDIEFLLLEIRKRHPESDLYLLGHSMGGLFAIHTAAEYGKLLSGVVLLNSWIQDTARLPFFTVIGLLFGGLFKSKRYWKVAGGAANMTTNPESVQMLEADTFWRKEQTATCLFQILLMRLAALQKARLVNNPVLVMQAEADMVVVLKTNRTAYERLGSREKIWKSYPGYHHDSEFEHDRSLLDNDLVTWLLERAPGKRVGLLQETEEQGTPGD